MSARRPTPRLGYIWTPALLPGSGVDPVSGRVESRGLFADWLAPSASSQATTNITAGSLSAPMAAAKASAKSSLVLPASEAALALPPPLPATARTTTIGAEQQMNEMVPITPAHRLAFTPLPLGRSASRVGLGPPTLRGRQFFLRSPRPGFSRSARQRCSPPPPSPSGPRRLWPRPRPCRSPRAPSVAPSGP